MMTGRFHVIVTLSLLTAIFCLAGCDRDTERRKIDNTAVLSEDELEEFSIESDSDTLAFGFDLRSSLHEDARQYVPLLRYLERTTGYRFRLRFTAEDGSVVDDLGRGVVHFAAIGAGSYIEAHEKYGVMPLVRGLNYLDMGKYRSVIVVAPDSPLNKVEGLRGKRFAFGSVTSTQGNLIPMIVLTEHGLTLDDFVSYEYTGSHRNCANSVVSGLADACGMQDTMAGELQKQGLVRIIYTSRYYPSSGIAVNKNVGPDVKARVKQALLDFQPKGKDAEGLHKWHMTEMPNGFKPAEDSDYAELRQWGLRLGVFRKNGN
jgi:phosphonate transport system substrate-binding protein